MSVTLVVATTSPSAGKMLVIWGPGGGGQPPVSQPQPVGGGGNLQMTQQLLLTYSGGRKKRFDGIWNSARCRYKGFPAERKMGHQSDPTSAIRHSPAKLQQLAFHIPAPPSPHPDR